MSGYTAPVFFKAQKDPLDVDDWIRDFSPTLQIPSTVGGAAAYDPIATINLIDITPTGGFTIQSQAVVSGQGGAATAVGFWLTAGGVPGTTYGIEIEVTTVGGRTFKRTTYLTVATR